MKFRILAGVAVTAIMAGSAFAADMPLKAPAPALAYDWGGMYIGGVIGGGWSHDENSEPGLGILGTLVNFPVVQTTTGSGFIGGVEGGDRYQFGKLVIGWEADMTWGQIGGSSNTGFGPSFFPPLTFNRALNTSINWTGTATSSVGIAHDRWLIYGKAGVAWANFSETDNSTVNLNLTGIGGPSISTPFFSGTGNGGNQDRDRVGWTVGTGIEWAIWNNWSVKVEYDYLDFGTRTTQVNGTVLPALGGGLGVSVGEQDTLHVSQVKAGLNWHIAPNYW
jgi:outer membrane immunogenic protein